MFGRLLAYILFLLLVPENSTAEVVGSPRLPEKPTEVRMQFRVTGLFQPDRKDDLIQQAQELDEVKLVSVDYETTIVTFAYDPKDPKSKRFTNAKPEQVLKHLDNRLRQVSQSTFTLLPLSTLPKPKWQEVKIAVVGLDCKGCAFAAYTMVQRVEGVERAVVSFKDGFVLAWIDPEKTNREALETALRKGNVRVAPKSK